MDYFIQTDERGARDLTDLRKTLERTVESNVHPPDLSDQTVIVEIRNNVTAKTSGLVAATQVTLVDDKWIDVRPLQVRVISVHGITASVAAPARRIATRVGTIGYCVQGEA